MRYQLLLLLSLFSVVLHAQLRGVILDEKGTPLPFVNIHIANSTIGTSSNIEGEFIINLPSTTNQLVFQYVGYRTLKQEIKSDLDYISITLQPENFQLDEITISADAEDPAYAIIRKAQAQRKANKNKLSNRSCDAYVRGFNKVIDAPEKIMGLDIGDMDGMLDSTRQGVVYLSESVSKLYCLDGRSKEVMYSSKVSGNDQGYSFNSAQEMNFNFYDNTLYLNREIISPIAWNALTHYKYKLIGATYDENNQLVNKIKVTPKNEFGNTFFGHIYINEDLWNINSFELGVTSKATNLPFIDTLTFKQIFAPVKKDLWVPLSNVINFTMSAFGFSVAGNFACVYSNYEIGTVKTEDFDKVVFEVLEESNQRTEAYWDTLRPIPLTLEQSVDYKTKDSIRIEKERPEYLDSIDRKNNKFNFTNLLTGYDYQNSHKHRRFSISSPLAGLSLNTIQGWNSNLSVSYSNNYSKKNNKSLKIELINNYGLSEKKYRPELSVDYLFNRKTNPRLTLSGGKKLVQYSRLNPISNELNSIFTLFFRENYLKAYDKNFVLVKFQRDLFIGFNGSLSFEYADRSALINNYNGGLRQDSKDFTSNNPLDPINPPAFANHQAAIVRAKLEIRPGQKVWKYPDRIFKENSNWPIIAFYLKSGRKWFNSDVNYNLLYASLHKYFSTHIYGESALGLMGGGFLGDKPDEFIDYYHFNGNRTHTILSSSFMWRFLHLPYYDLSTNDQFFQLHFHHNFMGYLISKVPLLKRTGWQINAGYKILTTPTNSYDEIYLGLSNLGIKSFRLINLYVVLSKLHKGENPSLKNKRNPSLLISLDF